MLLTLLTIGLATAGATYAAALGAARGWWPTTPRVAWAPPVLLVAVMRSLVYTAVAVAEWIVWSQAPRRAVGGALGLFVTQQVLATVWPVIFFAGYGWLGRADLWVTVAILVILDLVLGATVLAFWDISRIAGTVMAADLLLTLFVTALIIGSLGQHSIL